jgi:hypothetical protein
MSQQPDLDDPDLDGDPGLDGNPVAEHAAYDEWAAIAGETVPRAAVSLEERTGHAAASFDAFAATLTDTQIAARLIRARSWSWPGQGPARPRPSPPPSLRPPTSREPSTPLAPAEPTRRSDGRRACAVCGSAASFGYGVSLRNDRPSRRA